MLRVPQACLFHLWLYIRFGAKYPPRKVPGRYRNVERSRESVEWVAEWFWTGLEGESWRWSLLRPKNRYHHQGCFKSVPPMRYYSTGFPASHPIQSVLYWVGLFWCFSSFTQLKLNCFANYQWEWGEKTSSYYPPSYFGISWTNDRYFNWILWR